MRFALLTSLLLSGLAVVQGLTSTLQQVTNFGSNPTNVKMFVYKPTTVAAKPALIVAIHYCTGTAQAYFSGSPYAQLADQFGFIVIYPSSPWSGTCWDVSSKATLTHNGGGDSNAIANMVTFAIANFAVDSTRVFVTGSSSGAMMTNVMCATYPNLFKAASVYSGVPAGCFFSNFGGADAWNSTCAQGQSITTQAAWGAVARNMFPGYTGTYPAIQEYHGTADTTLFPQNLIEEEKQWAGVFGYNQAAPQQTLANTPLSGYTKSIFGPSLQGIIGQGVGHTVPIMGNEDMKWFGLVSGGAGTPGGGTSTTVVGTQPPTTTVGTQPPTTTVVTQPPTTTVSTPTQPTGGLAQHWDQCDGQGFTPKACVSPFTCTAVSPPWYFQCL